MKVLTVSVDKIGLLIGRGGSKVRETQETTGPVYYRLKIHGYSIVSLSARANEDEQSRSSE